MRDIESQKCRQCACEPLAVSAGQLAKKLGISLRQVWRMNAAGLLPRPVRLRRSVRWRLAEIEDWLGAGAPDRATWEELVRKDDLLGGHHCGQ